MSIYDDIQSAVNKVKCDSGSGRDINESVLSNTSGMTKEAIQRVIEEINVSGFLDVLKSGKNRAREFPLADPEIIFKMAALDTIVESDLIKDASVPGLDFYTREQTLYARSLPPLPITYQKKSKDISEHSTEFLMAKRAVFEKKAEMYQEAICKSEDIVAVNFHKIAEKISLNQECADKLIKSAATVFDGKERILLEPICKIAHVECNFHSPADIVEDTEELNLFKQAMRSLENIPELRRLLIESNLNKESMLKAAGKALTLLELMPNRREPKETKIKKKPLSYKDLDEREKRLMKEADEFSQDTMDKMESREKAVAKRGAKVGKAEKALGRVPLSKGIGTGFNKVQKSLIGIPKAITEYEGKFGQKVKGGLKTLVEAGPSQDDVNALLQQEVDVADKFDIKFKQKDTIEDLMATDEMLKGQDPVLISNLYKSLVDLAPRVSTKKEIVRSFLRQISSQAEPTIDPFYATQLIKLERAMSGDKNVRLD